MCAILLAFFASFIFIGLKSWQVLNVANKQYVWMLPTSMSMAVCEVYVIATTAHNGFGWMVIPVGLGGGLGCVVATWLNTYLVSKEK